MIVLPVLGFRASGKTTFLRHYLDAHLDEPGYFVLAQKQRISQATTIDMLTECENRAVKVAAFEMDFAKDKIARLSRIFPGSLWMPVLLDVPMKICANRIALDYAERKIPKDFQSENFYATCKKLANEIRQAREDQGQHVCVIPHMMSSGAAVSKVDSYVRTALKFNKQPMEIDNANSQ